mmetsp:Transcript_56989/g.162372  ORF Transcript_56989/g.162372 Transcript_56989/m.162372 type:complete len:375 (-) Transcript_56989:208-1332(-)
MARMPLVPVVGDPVATPLRPEPVHDGGGVPARLEGEIISVDVYLVSLDWGTDPSTWRRKVDVNLARVPAAGRDGLAVLWLQLEIKFFDGRMQKARVAVAYSDGGISVLLHGPLHRLDRGDRAPILNDRHVPLSAHIDVLEFHPIPTPACHRRCRPMPQGSLGARPGPGGVPMAPRNVSIRLNGGRHRPTEAIAPYGVALTCNGTRLRAGPWAGLVPVECQSVASPDCPEAVHDAAGVSACLERDVVRARVTSTRCTPDAHIVFQWRRARRIIDVDLARVLAAGRDGLAVHVRELEVELLQGRVPEGGVAVAHGYGRVALLLDRPLQVLDRRAAHPIVDDLRVPLPAHVDVNELHPIPALAGHGRGRPWRDRRLH